MSDNSGSTSLAALTLIGRLRGTRLLPLFVVLAIFAVAVPAAQLWTLRQYVNGSNLGFDLQHRNDDLALIGYVSQTWATLKSGDRLVSINGVAMDADIFFHTRAEMPVGPVTLEIERDGRRLTVTGEAIPHSLPSVLSVVIRWITGVLMSMLALTVFLLKPGTRASWAFTLFTLCTAALVLITPDFPLPLKPVFLFLFGLVAFAPLFAVHFFSLFPQPQPFVRLMPAFYVVGLVIWLSNTIAVLVGRTPALVNVLEIGVRLWASLVGLVAIAMLGVQWRTAKEARFVAATRTMIISVLIGLVVPIVATLFIRMTHSDGGLLHQITSSLVIIFVLTQAAVFVRFNPMEIDRYTAAVVGYFVTIASLGASAVIALFALPRMLTMIGIAASTEAVAAITAATILSFGPVYRRLRKRIDTIFSRSNADTLQTAEVIRRVADAVQVSGREDALKTIVHETAVIGCDYAGLWVVDAAGTSLTRTAFRGTIAEPAPVSRDAPISEAMTRPGGIRGLAATNLSNPAQEGLWSLNIAMSAPIRAHGVPVGFLGVGRRASGFGYRLEDQAFLEAMASQAGLALERGDVVTQIGRYRVERRIASGGMAEVFVAWQVGPGGFERKVALKRLLPDLAEDPRSSASLLDEARITARLQHRNIAQVFEVGLEANQHFIVMEFVDGPSLRALISAQNRANELTPMPVFLSVARGLLSALDHAHALTDSQGKSLNVVHRDVTPSNALVSRAGEVKLVDFGLVLATERLYRTKTGVARGTLPYMSLEQATQAVIDRRADVYSAAATLYEVLVGVRAFAEGPLGLDRPKPPSEARIGLPTQLDDVFFKAFASNANDRYPNTLAFYEALVAALPKVTPAPESTVAEWVRRYFDQSNIPNRTSSEITQEIVNRF